MNEQSELEILKLQDSLPVIRQVGGWTAEEFGKMIGVTKQTISNLESKKTVMSKTQYIAIRAVLDYEVSKRSDDDFLLASVIDFCLENDATSPEDRRKAQAFISGAKKAHLDYASIAAGLAALVGIVATGTPVFSNKSFRSNIWLSKLLKNSKQKHYKGGTDYERQISRH